MIGLLCFALAILASPFKSRLWLEAENAAVRQVEAHCRVYRSRVWQAVRSPATRRCAGRLQASQGDSGGAAKVDRLTRSVAFLSALLESGVEVLFCDLPQMEGPTGRFMLQQMATVAELEAGMISTGTTGGAAGGQYFGGLGLAPRAGKRRAQ
jgi:DNA invertase Pin-like site-specific DNA recombinase